jgi:F0F1-type ATP synthase membrane subunit b/b'
MPDITEETRQSAESEVPELTRDAVQETENILEQALEESEGDASRETSRKPCKKPKKKVMFRRK